MQRHDLKHLVIMRHGEADFPRGVPDHDRPLMPRGAREAAAAGAWLAEHAGPDMILVSPALRTRQTVTWVCSELGEKAPTPQLWESLYHGTDAQLVAAVNHVPETVRTLLVVAHMPGVVDAVLRLASRDSEPDAMMDAAGGFPTAGTAVLEVPGEWALLDGADARLTQFYAPHV
ncbi:histidine phosphatase family protein [Kocuria tytonicola]|uniref:Histidine phosphatase family protein n=1 Tax=Kocuria tytonicola TaxID=2055946 RepID=A0A3L9L5V9_9MICC|nr:histidine phosphatase family protein [Kocuria tytonicola]RLY94180.1 histidine phosphatase family protein [Kocuria tytonicola]